MHSDSITRVAMRWTPSGKRKTQRNLETLGREGNEGGRMDIGTSTTVVVRKTTLEISVMALCAMSHEED